MIVQHGFAGLQITHVGAKQKKIRSRYSYISFSHLYMFINGAMADIRVMILRAICILDYCRLYGLNLVIDVIKEQAWRFQINFKTQYKAQMIIFALLKIWGF